MGRDKTAIVTGAAGLVGSAAVNELIAQGYKVHAIDNDMRKYFFGEQGSTKPMREKLEEKYCSHKLIWHNKDLRQIYELAPIFLDSERIDLIIHAAAQPSHDWAAKEPLVDFNVNALGTLNMLELTRTYCPEATFAYISTSKVYGDNPNRLPLGDYGSRFDLVDHRFADGITTEMSIEKCLHSLFGVSKLSADLLVQEYGRYFNMPTVCFRPGCVTGPAHAGVELHGFLSYLVKCGFEEKEYKVYGYEGKQVRCNIYASDLVKACLTFHDQGPIPGSVFNIGGGRESSISILEAFDAFEEISGQKIKWKYEETPRIGDHIWWISDIEEFQLFYNWEPEIYRPEYMMQKIYEELYTTSPWWTDANV